MSLTWHIVQKDLRALKWPLGLWLLCIVVKLGIGVMLLNATGEEGAEWFRNLDIFAKSLAAGELLSFVLVAALIQEDLMVGTTAFWMTRPISGGRLLCAKLLSIGLVFIVAPVLVTLPWWLGCNYGSGEIAWAAAETVAVHAIVVLAALLWAAVTDGLGRFLMWTLVTLFTLPTLTGIIAYYSTRGRPAIPSDLVATRLALAVGLAALGALVVVVHQFLTRRTLRSAAIIGATVGASALFGAFWPWSWNLESRMNSLLIQRAQGKWPASAEPPGLTFALAPAVLESQRPGTRADRPYTLRMQYRVEGLTTAQVLMPYWSEHTMRWADGTTESGRGWGRSGMAEMVAQKSLGAGLQPIDDGKYEDTIRVTSLLAPRVGEKLQAAPPAYALFALLQLLRFEAATPVAKQAGDWDRFGGLGERIGSMEKDGERLLVTFIRHAPSLWVNNVAGGQLAPVHKFNQHFLVNRGKDFVDRGSSVGKLTTRIGTVEIAWSTMAFRASKNGGGPRPLPEAIAALDEAELIKVTYVEQVRFTHEFKVDPFKAELTNP
jgi:hypothetical protein